MCVLEKKMLKKKKKIFFFKNVYAASLDNIPCCGDALGFLVFSAYLPPFLVLAISVNLKPNNHMPFEEMKQEEMKCTAQGHL